MVTFIAFLNVSSVVAWEALLETNVVFSALMISLKDHWNVKVQFWPLVNTCIFTYLGRDTKF